MCSLVKNSNSNYYNAGRSGVVDDSLHWETFLLLNFKKGIKASICQT